MNPAENKIIYSLVVPLSTDTNKFDKHIANVCSVLDDQIPNCYEIVAIDGEAKDVDDNEWDNVQGEILLIIDGDLDSKPITLSDIIASFKQGSDMAFAEQYKKGIETKTHPELSYFGIRRSSLKQLNSSLQGYQLMVEILGPDTIEKLATNPSAISGNYILKNLKKVIGVQPSKDKKNTKK